MGDSSTEINRPVSDSAAIELTGKVMMVSIVLLFLVVVFVIFLHLYAKRFLYIREDEDEEESSVATRRRRRFDFAPAPAALRRGLHPSVLKSLPSITFNPKDFKEGLECAVCLSDLADGEKARILPKCNHGFHVDCIDMWFQSHSTCPICRNPVSNQPSTTPELTPEAILGSPRAENSPVRGIFFTETPNFPTNVLFWGNETRVSTLGSSLEEDRQAQAPNSSELPSSSSSSSSVIGNDRGDKMLVIDIPNQIDEDEEQKSPMTTRLRSLKRLLSREKRVSPCCPTVDAEHIGQGES